MNQSIRSKVINIGNSRGVRIPKTILEQAGLTDEVEMRVEGNKLVINARRLVRADWKAKFSLMAAKGDDQLLDGSIPTQWDQDEWTW